MTTASSQLFRAAAWFNPFSGGLAYGIIVVIFDLVSIVILNYTFSTLRYRHAQRLAAVGEAKLPPQFPFLIPFIGPIFKLWWDHGKFIRELSFFEGRLTSNKLTILGHTFYSFQDRETIENLFKQSSLSSPIHMYGFVSANLLGLSKKTMSIYRADDSGPFPKPHPASGVLPHNRIDWVTHHTIFPGLAGPGLQPTTTRFVKSLQGQLQDLLITEEWSSKNDLAQLFREVIGASALKSILGPTIFRLNPSFVEDMFTFDKIFPKFAPGLPAFMMPETYRSRDRLVNQFKDWYRFAREHFDPSKIDEDGDGDPFWGSGMMRSRQENILKVDEHDDDALARVDLGLAWATIGNVVLSAMFSSFHIFKDKELLGRVRQDVQQYLGQTSVYEADPAQLAKNVPLLSSIYAETLRVYIKVYSAFGSAHEEVNLGKWRLPRGALAVISSEPSHMDPNFWNTQNGEHPVQSFWADRFIVDPSSPESGPVSPSHRKRVPKPEKENDDAPFFSMEGCEGAWIPYGGGYSMCPGRFFARNIIVLTSAILATECDVEVDGFPEFTKNRYGMGVEDLKAALPFRIRKRARSHE
ncbi:Pfs, NACHT and ankyrin domain protein [Xylaria sp. CBS 124048]|nr:Pfs, NACHT and ankyrin domain protein [Xylaria sp. CBS 124048]